MCAKPLSRPQTMASLTTLAAMLLAFALINSPVRDLYQLVHHLPVTVRVRTLGIDKPLILWINDGLMVFFFPLIAPLKREILEGQLSTPQAIATPGFAALGGMAVPALTYAAFNAGEPVAVVAEIGFTMSLFIAWLAFAGSESFRGARLSVVTGSIASAIAGTAVLWSAHRRRVRAPAQVEPFP